MSESVKMCANCQWGKKQACSDKVGCTCPAAPVSDLMSRQCAAGFYCCHWTARLPTRYQPGDGPFWAQWMDDLHQWVVLARCAGATESVYTHTDRRWPANEYVDALNRVCREWARAHPFQAVYGDD